MYSRNILAIGMIILLVTSCSDQNRTITTASDYDYYLDLNENKALQTALDNLIFWEEKLEKDPDQFPYYVKLASSQSQLFNLTGKIDHLKNAQHNLEVANKMTNYNNAGYLRALARNFVSQHKFKDALLLLDTAEENGENLQATQKMLFDVHLELGNYKEANVYLTKIKDLGDFDYLIRTSKWNDHLGNLDAAITYMEKALLIAESSKNKGLMQWAYTNIADYYGHDGQIKKSYQYFLKALALNPSNAYAKKGITWIVYSYERNPDEAMRILNALDDSYQSPDILLFKAEIAESQGHLDDKIEYISQFFAISKDEKYGDMYNVHNAYVYAEELEINHAAIALAKEEVENRPTPETYDLLAWMHFQNQNYDEALNIAENHVIDKTYEPMALLHTAQIYKATGHHDKVKRLKKELLESTYELGPVLEKRINSL